MTPVSAPRRLTALPATLVAAAVVATALALSQPADARPLALASLSACPNQSDRGAPPAAQRRAMLCLTNHARRAHGLRPLRSARPLNRAAGRKSADILACDEFSHEACGRDFTHWIKRFGYARGCWSAAENIGYGTGELGTARAIFRAWMNSPGHRANILGKYTEIGIGLRTGTLGDARGAAVWTQAFGSRGC